MRIDVRRGVLRAVLVVALVGIGLPLAVLPGPSAALADQRSDQISAPGDPSPDRLDRAAAYLRQHMTDARIPGLAYAIVRGDRVVGQGTWGVDGDGRPVDADTPFVLGSVTKSFTALAVLQLVEAGQIELDTPVRRYVSWLRLADESTASRITVRHLLTHTTGLPQVAAMGLTDRYDNSPDGLTRSVRDLAAVAPTTAPGGAYQYSDANYLILGAMVEAVARQPYGDYLRGKVLGPLGMTRSAATEAEARAVGVPAGHRYYFGRPQRFAPPFDGSGVSYGFVAASLTDLTHYAIAQVGDGRYGPNQVLSAAGVAQLHTGQVATEGAGQYGMGWRDSTLDGAGVRIVWHAGATANSFSHILLVPESDLAVVVLSNTYSLAMDGPLAAAAFNVTRILHGAEPVAAAKDPVFDRLLAALLIVAGALSIALVWSLVRTVRRARRGAPVPARGRVILGAAGWLAGCVAVAGGVLFALPAAWDGAGLAQVLLWTPDIGQATIGVATLAGVLALVRLTVAGHLLRSSTMAREARTGLG